METPNYKQFAVSLAKEAGEIMKKYFGLDTKTEWKADNSPLTEADTLINTMVIEKVKERFPDHSILGEEGSFKVEGSTFTWVCDPIDGTLPFSVGMPICTFSLALVDDGEVILGVIYDPFCDRLFTAEKGQGAFLNDKPIKVSSKDTLVQAHINNDSKELAEATLELRDLKAKITRLYCVTYPGVLVACGKFEAVMFGGPTTWDIAAQKIIVEEAGGKVTDQDGNEQRYDQPINGALVSNGLLHETLLEMIKKYR